MARTWMEYLSAETLEAWAENMGRCLDAIDLILDGITENVDHSDLEPEVQSSVMAAHLLLAEARIYPRLLLEETDFQHRIQAIKEKTRGDNAAFIKELMSDG